jgi:hypothetical protein
MYGNYELIARYLGPDTEITPEREFRHQHLANAAAAPITKARKAHPAPNAAVSRHFMAQNLVAVGHFFRPN